MEARLKRGLVVGAAIGAALAAAILWGFQQPGGIAGMVLLVATFLAIPTALVVAGVVHVVRRRRAKA